MSLHAFFEMPDQIDFVIGVGGYLFPFSKFQPTADGRVRVMHGLSDTLRPWEYVKTTYEKKLEVGREIILLEDTDHEVNERAKKEMINFMKTKL